MTVQWIHFHSTHLLWASQTSKSDSPSFCLFPFKLSDPLGMLYETAPVFHSRMPEKQGSLPGFIRPPPHSSLLTCTGFCPQWLSGWKRH